MKTLEDKSVDCFICDLPYGCLTGGGITKKETAEKYGRKGTEGISGCSWDIKIDLEKFWEQIRRIRKSDHSPCLMFCTTKFGFELYNSNPTEFRYDLVWDKQKGVSFLTANKMPMRSHEMIYVFSKAGAYYNRVDLSGGTPYPPHKNKHKAPNTYVFPGSGYTGAVGQAEGKRCMKSVISMTIEKTKGGHPTEKPMTLYHFLIQRYCPVNGTVLDPTAGSFNSVFTAVELGRNGIGIEKDDKFFEKAEKRLESQNTIVDS